MIIDTHCHLEYDYSPFTVTDLLQEAEKVGVTRCVSIGTTWESFPLIQSLAHQIDSVFFTVGIHPCDSQTALTGSEEQFLSFLKDDKCCAVGEIGLDYFRDSSFSHTQQEVLEKQLSYALDVNKPVVIHSRCAEEDLLRHLKKYSDSSSLPIPGVIHCFTGTKKTAFEFLDLGFFISFSGILTFQKAQELKDVASVLPLDHLVLETDSPYLAPVPFRGKKCRPFMIQQTAQALAALKNLSLEEIEHITTDNAFRLFPLLK